MNWENIRVYNNSQNNAFEELVCQLARQEKSNGYIKLIRNGTPDGGVECFWQLENGKEYAWQATITLTVNVVYPYAGDSKVYSHEVTVRPLDNGGVQYVSNRIIPSEDNEEETWHTPRLTSEEWEEMYQSNRAAGP